LALTCFKYLRRQSILTLTLIVAVGSSFKIDKLIWAVE
jgi:hypothetical protein